jgi:membrane protease YdiL (CAAX protease family)
VGTGSPTSISSSTLAFASPAPAPRPSPSNIVDSLEPTPAVIAAVATFVLFTYLAAIGFRRLRNVDAPVRRRLLQWRARGWALAAVGVLTGYVAVVLSIGGAERDWWPPTNPVFIGLGTGMPTWIGLAIVFATVVGERAYRRYPGPIPHADRGVFPRRPDEGGA